MKARWNPKMRAWRARTPLWLYLTVAWGQCFVFCFLSLAALNYWLDDQFRNARNLGVYYWPIGVCLSIVIALGLIPLMLAQWYEARRVPEETKPKGSGLYAIYALVLMWGVSSPSMELIRNPNSRAQILPLHWTLTQGKLLSFKSGIGTENYFKPDLRYSYTVNGQRYESSQVSFEGEGNGSVSFATALPWKKLVGHAIPVYYDALHPELAALVVRQGPNYGWMIRLSIFAFAWCMGLAAVFHEDSKRTAEKSGSKDDSVAGLKTADS